MEPIDAYLILRDGKPMHLRFTLEQAKACVGIEERMFFGRVEIKAVTVMEKTENEQMDNNL